MPSLRSFSCTRTSTAVAGAPPYSSASAFISWRIDWSRPLSAYVIKWSRRGIDTPGGQGDTIGNDQSLRYDHRGRGEESHRAGHHRQPAAMGENGSCSSPRALL